MLRTLIRSGSGSNPAFDSLVDSYARYHLVFVAVGSAFVVMLFAFCVLMWVRFATVPPSGSRRWAFEKKVYFAFGTVAAAVGVLLALIVAANVSTLVSPSQGFAGAIGLLARPREGTQAHALHQSFVAWLESGSPRIPALIESRIDERLAWQQPKAIVCAVLLLAFAVLGARIWRTLIRASRVEGSKWSLRDGAGLAAGVVATGVCLLLILMVLGNTQASLAPLSMTLFYG